MTELRERLARALAKSQARDDEGEYERLADLIGFSGDNKLWTALGAAVDAILTELEAAGYVVVPVVPIEAMLEAASEVSSLIGIDPAAVNAECLGTWQAMLKARLGP